MRWLAGLLVVFVFIQSRAQSPADNWYFGEGIGVHFETQGLQTLTDGAQNAIRATTTVSSEGGALLFYSTDSLVWNRFHEVMPNGSGLQSSPYASQMRAVQIADSLYALFTLEYDSPVLPTSRAKLVYSLINMTFDSGNGDIDTNFKNVFLEDSMSTKLTAFRRCSDLGYWILARSGVDKRIFSYPANSSGVSNSPVISQGIVSPDPCCGTDQYGRVSPDGRLLLFAHSHPASIEFLEFDRSSGTATPLFTIDSFQTNHFPYALEFSPNGQYLYASFEIAGQLEGALVQYELDPFDSNTIISSVDTLAVGSRIEAIQRGPNGKIYTSTHDSFLHIIHVPDSAYPWCGFEFNGYSLEGFGISTSLPTYDASFTETPLPNRVVCSSDTVIFTLLDSCVDALIWNFGDSISGADDTSSSTTASHRYTNPGLYQVSLLTIQGGDSNVRTGTIRVLPSDPVDPFNTDSSSLCRGSTVGVNINDSLTNFIWSTGSDSSSITADSTGFYQVSITHPCYQVYDSIFVELVDTVQISLVDTAICSSVVTHINPVSSSNISYLWSTGDTTDAITLDTSLSTDLSPVDIWLIATNACGSDSDTMTLSFIPLPDAGLPPDSVQCFDAPVPVMRADQDSTIYTWNDGTDDASKLIEQDTIIWLIASNVCGSDTDSMQIRFHPEIKVELGEDTFLCEGDSVVLDASWPQASYSWTSLPQTLTGDLSDSIQVIYPESGSTSTPFDDAQDEPLGVTLQTEEEVNYVVTITEGPCTLVESRKVSIQEEQCDSVACKFEVANVFTPNGDGINDVLRISNPCEDLNYRVSIYNRWGQLVFFGNSSFSRWDGTVNGEPASEGTYYVVVEQDGVSVQRNGVTLLR